jgi:hypothetical protein
MNPEEEFLLSNPAYFYAASGILPCFVSGRSYPVGAPHTLRYVLSKPVVSDVEPFVTAGGIKLVSEDIFTINIMQPAGLLGDEVIECKKSMITQCDLSTEHADGWLECPRFYASQKVLDFQTQ